MKLSLYILIWSLVATIARGADIPPFPVNTNEAYSVTTDSSGSTTNAVKVLPWLMATMDPETGKMILETPPQWMLDGPKTNFTTIQIECMAALSNTVVSGEFKSYKPVAFVKWKVIEE